MSEAGAERGGRGWPWRRRQADRPAGGPDRMLTVVIADDVEALRVLVRETIEPPFVIVGEASDGREAVSLCQELKPDIVLLDLNMPSHDGLEAIAPIRAASPDTVIVVLTGLAPELIADKALALGAHAFVDKAQAIDELPGVLQRTVRERPAG